MVHNPSTVEQRGSITSSSNAGSALTGPVSTPSTRETTFDGMEIERDRLLSQGCSYNVVATLLQARKNTTNSTYGRVWQKCTSLAQQQSWKPL